MTILGIVLSIILIAVFWRLFAALAGLVLVAVFFLFVLLTLGGCATTDDPLVSEWNDQAIVENYNNCMAVYKAAGRGTVHLDHTHTRPMTHSMQIHAYKSDLVLNNCRKVLGGLWVDSL